jgi:hypothetical protein
MSLSLLFHQERELSFFEPRNFFLERLDNFYQFLKCGMWVRSNRWHKFQRKFSNQTSEIRYVREIIFGKRGEITYWELTTDPEALPENSTSFVELAIAIDAPPARSPRERKTSKATMSKHLENL